MEGSTSPAVRQYSRTQALVLSFFSKELYRDIGRNWRGVGLLYLLMLLALSWVPVMIKAHVQIGAFARNDFPGVVKDFPPITIKDGVVSSPVPQPYTISDPKTAQPMFVMDTTGKITSPDETTAIILLTSNKLYVREQGKGQTRIQDLSQIKSFYVDRARVQGWMDVFAKWFAIGAYPLAMLGSFIYRAIQILIYALIGMLFAMMFNVKLNYAALMRIAAVAITPVVILDTLVGLAGINVPVWWLICLVIALAYVAFGVKANYDPSIEQTPGFPVGMPAPPTFGAVPPRQ